jgi:pyridoxal/pyridoxine/pyridoxamine kinase
MKKQNFKIVMLMAALLPMMALAQSPADALFDKYSQKEGFTSVYITQQMFSLFADMDTEDNEEGFIDLVKNLTCIKIISVDDTTGALNKKVNFYDEIMKSSSKQKYEELMVVKKNNQDIKFLIRKDGKIINELLMVVGGTEENVLISIQGNIDLKTISKLSKAMKIEGMENLEEIEKK